MSGDDGHADSAAACRRFRVTGRVQGVFFRASTQTVARDLGLAGYARNLDDGSVEVLACGGRAALDELERWLADGPPMASVQEVRASDAAWQDLDSFRTG